MPFVMGRYRGIGMPRAKKAKVVQPDPVEETQMEPPPPPEPPAPPSPKATAVRVVAPESPAKSLVLAAQIEARRMAR